jgi:long-chain fatty acid transport protein
MPPFRLLLILGLVAVSSAAFAADGNELFGMGAVQKGLGGAGTATAYDATWVLLNPAATIELGQRFDFSLETLYIHTEAETRGFPLVSNPFSGDMENTQWVPVPAMGYTQPLGGGALGLGMLGTQGNKLTYAHPRTTVGWLGNGDRRSEFQVVKLPITYAYPLGNGWTVGAGIVPVVGRFRTDSVSLTLREAEANHSWDTSFGGGVLLSVHKRAERWSLGAVYSSRVKMQAYDKYAGDVLRSSFDLPQKFQAGVGFKPKDNVELLLDYKWMDWDSIDQLGLKATQNGLGWRDSHIVKLGANWDIDERWSLRGGMSYGRAAVREDTAFVNVITPALAEWHFSLGASRRIGDRHEVHASFTHVPPEEIFENGKGDLFSKLGRGTRIGYAENSLTLQYSLKF